MTRKDNFMKFIDNAIANQEGIEVFIDDSNQPFSPSICNSFKALEEKKKEYQRLYDNDLKLINDKSIQIKEYKFII